MTSRLFVLALGAWLAGCATPTDRPHRDVPRTGRSSQNYRLACDRVRYAAAERGMVRVELDPITVDGARHGLDDSEAAAVGAALTARLRAMLVGTGGFELGAAQAASATPGNLAPSLVLVVRVDELDLEPDGPHRPRFVCRLSLGAVELDTGRRYTIGQGLGVVAGQGPRANADRLLIDPALEGAVEVCLESLIIQLVDRVT